MPNQLPGEIKQKILEMPEDRQGVKKVKVRLKDGREFKDVYVAWGSEVVKVGSGTVVPFDPAEVVDVFNDL